MSFTDLLAIGFLLFFLYLLGFRVVRKTSKEEQFNGVDPTTNMLTSTERRQIMLEEIHKSPFSDVLTHEQVTELRAVLAGQKVAPAADSEPSVADEVLDSEFTDSPVPQEPELAPAFVPPRPVTATTFVSSPASTPQVAHATTGSAESLIYGNQEEEPASSPPPPPKEPRTPVIESIRASWDPAVMMLYLGALLVVVAGLIFATYNWGSLGGWQKLGMLGAGTAAFLVAGFAIRNVERVKPASTTFMIIGGLLVPANFLASYTVFDDVQPAMPLLLGAIATTIIHALLSTQPGASIFKYSAVGAAIVGIVAIPAAVGFDAGWGGVLGLAVIAIVPDHLFGLRRFQQPWEIISRSAASLLAGFALWQGYESDQWIIAGALIGVSMVANRYALKYMALRDLFVLLADIAIVAASVKTAQNLNEEQWMLAAGLLATALILWRESWRYPREAGWFELASFITFAWLSAEVARVLEAGSWPIVIGSFVLSTLMLLHARRHNSLAANSEAIAALAFPVGIGTALYALEPSLWNLVGFLAALAITTGWLALRREYDFPWPGFLATLATLGTILAIAPALDFDIGWGAVAVMLVAALAPYPLGRLLPLHNAWISAANIAVLPLAGLAIWSGIESNDWIVPITFVAISMWFHRLALEELPGGLDFTIPADAAAIAAGISFAWTLQGDRWLLATALLGVTLVLLKCSRSWPSYAGILQFVAVWSGAFFVGEVTRELAGVDWLIPATALSLTIGMMIHARFHADYGWMSEEIAVWALPLAIYSGMHAVDQPYWSVPVATIALTFTLVAHRIRHRIPGDINLAIASLAGIAAVISTSLQLDLWDTDNGIIAVALATGVALTLIANLVLPQFASVSGWLKTLLRLEALPIFAFAAVMGEFENAPVYIVVILAMFLNMWATRFSLWSLPLAFTMWAAMGGVLMPADASNQAALWWHVALAAVFSAIAWQLDRIPGQKRKHQPAGIYLWFCVIAISMALLAFGFSELSTSDATLQHGLALIALAVMIAIGYLSAKIRGFLLAIGLLASAASIIWIFGDLTSMQHGVLAAIVAAAAASLYLNADRIRILGGFAAVLLGLVYFQLSTDFDYSRDLLIVVVIAWIIMSLAIARWRQEAAQSITTLLVIQVAILHGVAIVLPMATHGVSHLNRPDLVLVLISLAGVVATYGSLVRSREVVLLGSGIGMSALMLQINIGSPGNLHIYTVPLSMYLLAVGLLLRRDPRIANTLLAAGSAMLVIPAMIEALTTGEIFWLWVALAESVGLFLFGTVLRLRIPTAAGVIAVSVIALRMLVFAVSVLASWVSILAIGVALLLLGTLWLLFREAIQGRAQALFSRWRSFD